MARDTKLKQPPGISSFKLRTLFVFLVPEIYCVLSSDYLEKEL